MGYRKRHSRFSSPLLSDIFAADLWYLLSDLSGICDDLYNVDSIHSCQQEHVGKVGEFHDVGVNLYPHPI